MARRPRLRGTQLAVFIHSTQGVPFIDALKNADCSYRVIASNKRLDDLLVSGVEPTELLPVFRGWSGTIAAYNKPGQKLGRAIEYIDPNTKYRWILDVPQEYRKMKDAVLVIEHPDYFLEKGGKNFIFHANPIDVVKGFPVSNGWYIPEIVHGIPTGAGVISGTRGARYLWRDAKRVGPAIRAYYGFTLNRAVDLDSPPSNHYGMIVEDDDQVALSTRVRQLRIDQLFQEQFELTTPLVLTIIREGETRLVIEGTSEQVDAAVRLFEELAHHVPSKLLIFSPILRRFL